MDPWGRWKGCWRPGQIHTCEITWGAGRSGERKWGKQMMGQVWSSYVIFPFFFKTQIFIWGDILLRLFKGTQWFGATKPNYSFVVRQNCHSLGSLWLRCHLLQIRSRTCNDHKWDSEKTKHLQLAFFVKKSLRSALSDFSILIGREILKVSQLELGKNAII